MKNHVLKKSLYYLQYLLYQAVSAIVNLLPYSMALSLGEGVGASLYHLKKYRREIALENLRAAFGAEKSEEEIQNLARLSFKNMVRVFVEFIRIPKTRKDPSRYFGTLHTERVWKALEGKKGLILIVSHYTNWELMAIATGIEGLPLHAIGRPVKNPFVYERIKKLRGETGLKSIDKMGAVREMLKLLRENQIICVLIDQHAGDHGIWIDFFGRECSTTPLPAMIALKKKCPVIPCFGIREPGGRFVVDFQEPFELIETGNYAADLTANTALYTKKIEEVIRKNPGDWLWMHRRWKNRPEPLPSPPP